MRRARIVDAAGSAGQDVTGGLMLIDASGAAVIGVDLGIHAEFTQTPRNELRILRAEIYDRDPAALQIYHR